jgi:outer membrane protein
MCTARFGTVVLILAAGGAAQTLSLRDALNTALQKSPTHKAALAEQRVSQSGIAESRAALLPHVAFTESVVRSNDPVFVFGAKLRQQSFTAADFDLNRLNRPTPLSNFTARFGGEWRLWDNLQSFRSLHFARLQSQAMSHQVDRADQEIIARVIDAYYDVLRWEKQIQLAQASLTTAQAIADRAQTRMKSGVALESDVLSANVAVAERQQELVAAENALNVSQARLAVAMGLDTDRLVQPSETLTEKDLPLRPISDLEKSAVANRPDLRRVDLQKRAHASVVANARAAFGPQVNAFGGWETDNHSIGWNGPNNWTAGIELQFDFFSGGAKLARLNRERAVQEQMEAMQQAFTDNIRLEVRAAHAEYDSANRQVAIARGSIAQARESLRIIRNRYEAGLTTITDLLRAEEAERRAQTGYWDAVYRSRTSYAQLQLATGELTPESPVVTP